MQSTRRTYLKGLAGAGIVTVTPTGKVLADGEDDYGSPEETPPAKGDCVMGLTVDPIEQVRVGIIGLGSRGHSAKEDRSRSHPVPPSRLETLGLFAAYRQHWLISVQ